MKTLAEWAGDLADFVVRDGVEVVPGRTGEPTVRVDGVYLHSLYRPREEAARLVESASLDPARPVLVIGLGLGYHVAALASLGVPVCVVEPDYNVVKAAAEGPLKGLKAPVGAGDVSEIAESEVFRTFVAKNPQLLVHPATARIHPTYADAVKTRLARVAIGQQRLGVAVVGPLYGGSLPIARYLADAFTRLGHRTLFVDNSRGWPLYEAVTGSVAAKKAAGQLSGMLAHFHAEWSYARVKEFAPNLCIVLAQAPVGTGWPERLQREKIVTAYWFVENWRHMTYWKEVAPRYDFFFHIQPGEFEEQLTAAGCVHHAYVQTACDPTVHRPVTLTPDERNEYGCDLSFAGAGYRNRNLLFAGLTDYRFKIWGVEWTARELQPLVCRPSERFTPDQFTRIVAGSAINLNLHSSATHDAVDPRCDAVNPRVFEIAACGGFQLSDPCIGLEHLFDFEKELPVYRNLRELRGKIDYYLARPAERASVAEAARKRALAAHTYEHRALQMTDLLLEKFAGRIAEKGIRAQRSVSEVAAEVGADSPLGRYLSTLPPGLPFSQAAFYERIPVMGTELSYPEAIFAYLREMRTSSEQLLAMFDDV